MTLGESPYVVDTGIWIDLKRHYPKDIFPDIWDDLSNLFNAKRLWSPYEVLIELLKVQDGLGKLLEQEFPDIFVPADNAFLQAVANVRLTCPRLQNPDSTNNVADPHVIALASLYHGNVLCTEVPAKSSNGRMKVPDACKVYNLRCLNCTDFLRERKKELGTYYVGI